MAAAGRDAAVEIGTDVDAAAAAMLTASRVLIAISVRSLAAVRGAVTLPQFRTLVVLASRGPINLGTLAEQLGVNPSTAMRMVDRLEAAGLIDRRVNPASRRELILRLTAPGQDVVDRVTARRRAEIAAVLTRMPASDRVDMVKALASFAEAAGEPPADAADADPYTAGWH